MFRRDYQRFKENDWIDSLIYIHVVSFVCQQLLFMFIFNLYEIIIIGIDLIVINMTVTCINKHIVQ